MKTLYHVAYTETREMSKNEKRRDWSEIKKKDLRLVITWNFTISTRPNYNNYGGCRAVVTS